MQVKKFEAPTMAEALKIIKTELGPEAIILSTKQNKKGFGLLSKASVEVTAAVSAKALQKKAITERLMPDEVKEDFGRMSATKQSKIYDNFGGYVQKRREEGKKRAMGATSAAMTGLSSNRYVDIQDDDQPITRTTDTTPVIAKPARQAMQQAISQMPAQGYGRNAKIQLNDAVDAEEMTSDFRSAASTSVSHSEHPAVENLQSELSRLKQIVQELKSEQTAISDTSIAEHSGDELRDAYRHLIRNGIDRKLAAQLTKAVQFQLSQEDLSHPDRILDQLAVELMGSVKIEDILENHHGGRQVVALVGPTGVGKTTTIAKLASQAILQRNLKVGLINVDAYKVAALDQLATYAKILNVPFRNATTPSELDRALAEFKPMDLVLIDTSGRSQRDAESLAGMKALLEHVPGIRTVLIAAATTRDQELYDIANRFKIFNPKGLLMSKLDECAAFGCVYSLAVKTGLPLTCFTVGQRVPEDIEAATPERLAALILDL